MNLGERRWHGVRVTASILCGVAAVLTIFSLFPSLYFSEVGSGDRLFSASVNAWQMEVDGLGAESGGNEAPKVGYPLVFAAVALVCAAVAGAFAAPRGATAGGHRVSGLITAIAGAFLAGTVWTVVVQATSWVENISDFGGSLEVDVDSGYGPAFWLLLVATLAAVVAAVLALVPVRGRYPLPAPYDPAIANLPTPPFGIAIPVPPSPPPPPPPPPVVAILPEPVPFQPPAAPIPADLSATPGPAELVLPQLPPTEPPVEHAPAVPAVEDPLAPPPLGSTTDGRHQS